MELACARRATWGNHSAARMKSKSELKHGGSDIPPGSILEFIVDGGDQPHWIVYEDEASSSAVVPRGAAGAQPPSKLKAPLAWVLELKVNLSQAVGFGMAAFIFAMQLAHRCAV